MANLSQIKRERMLRFLQTIREEHKDDDDVLIAIGEIESELNAKKYGLVWEQHEEEVDVMMRDNIPVFTEITDKEISADSNQPYNFLLEGDNLHSLRLLEKTHTGKIDVIYIDPPYNTGGKDFVYNDAIVGSEDTFKHSKWLSFMYNRLKIAKELLSDDGVIFISIDDNEQSQLKLLCDSVFGEDSFVALIPWRKRTAKSDVPYGISQDYESIICYAKSTKFKASVKGKERKYFETPDFPGRPWRFHDLTKQTTVAERPNSGFTMINPKNGEEYPANPLRSWAITKETFDDYYVQNRIIFPGDYDFINISKPVLRYWKEDDMKKAGDDFGRIAVTTKLPDDIGMSQDGTKEITAIFGEKKFSFPKPTSLIKYLISVSTFKKPDATVLDFFAGSGTTGHAVLQLNAEDGGHRHFILCTNNENNICEEVTYERIKRVIEGYGEVSGIPANLKYYRTDFVSKNADNISDELLFHITEMIQLEHGVKIDGKNYLMVMSDEESDELEAHWNEYLDVKALYVSKNVLFTSSQSTLFSQVEAHVIPDYYFKFELQEVGEAW